MTILFVRFACTEASHFQGGSWMLLKMYPSKAVRNTVETGRWYGEDVYTSSLDPAANTATGKGSRG